MSKLQQWLTAGLILTSVWLATVLKGDLPEQYTTHAVLAPLYFVALFGLTSVAIILYRVATFNDCVDAASELQNEVNEAKAALKKLGFTAGAAVASGEH